MKETQDIRVLPGSKIEQHEMIRNFLTNLLELGGHIVVHTNGTVSYVDRPQEPVMYRINNEPDARPLVVYRTMSDVHKGIFINPFVEPIGDLTNDKKWFYNTTNVIHTTVFARIVELLTENVIRAANGEKIENEYLIHALSGIVGNADTKTEKEFATLIKNLPEFEGGIDDKVMGECMLVTENPKPKDFVTISVSKKDGRAWLHSFLADEEDKLKKKFGSRIRKKTWTLMESIFKEIYGVDNLDIPLIEEISNEKGCPGFIAYVKVLIKSWNKFIPYLQFLYSEEEADAMVERIVALESVLPHIDKLSQVACWARGSHTGNVELKSGASDSRTSAEEVIEKVKARRGRPPRLKPTPLYDDDITTDDQVIERDSSRPQNSDGFSKRSLDEVMPDDDYRGRSKYDGGREDRLRGRDRDRDRKRDDRYSRYDRDEPDERYATHRSENYTRDDRGDHDHRDTRSRERYSYDDEPRRRNDTGFSTAKDVLNVVDSIKRDNRDKSYDRDNRDRHYGDRDRDREYHRGGRRM